MAKIINDWHFVKYEAPGFFPYAFIGKTENIRLQGTVEMDGELYRNTTSRVMEFCDDHVVTKSGSVYILGEENVHYRDICEKGEDIKKEENWDIYPYNN